MYDNICDDKVRCPICLKLFKQINNAHLKSHTLTFQEFKSLYPNSTIHSDAMKKSYGKQSEDSRNKLKLISSEKKNERILKYNSNPNKCLKCDALIDYHKKNNKFCSHSCSATFSQTGIKRPDTFREKISNILKEKVKNGTYIPISKRRRYTNKLKIKNATYIPLSKRIPYTNKIYELTCTTCEKIFRSKNHNTKTCSLPCRKIHHAVNNFKQNKTTGKCGYYNNIWCASSWELAFLVYNLLNNKSVNRYKGHFIYQHPDGTQKRYFPDFIIDDVIYEVKGRITNEVDSKLKSVTDKNLKIALVTRKDIIPMIKHVKDHFKVKDITSLYGGMYQ